MCEDEFFFKLSHPTFCTPPRFTLVPNVSNALNAVSVRIGPWPFTKMPAIHSTERVAATN